ncbi:DUF5672 family protein [Olivibacter sitiensis]|uniref:DUF5672 family protein n=1 Tax=Olivibacter sitiensis TaxID=376470 RepID=UPI0004883A67|nr:DUF5672 family protein [Olivibacter sitiensis]
MEENHKVAIVIPVYKEIADPVEKRSFWQCMDILVGYPIVLVVPQSLNTTYYETLAKKPLIIERFPNEYFLDITSYSRLLVSRLFYKRFLTYEYILLYQLDAWVFRDELALWTGKGYDYVGAPWLEAPPITSGKKPIINLSSKLVNKVGNGGLSLRKVKSHLAWSKWTRFLFIFLPKNEDVLWTLFVPFKKPNAREALHFAFERSPRKSFELINEQLPMGCHAWQKYEPSFWSQFIKY